MDWHLQTVTIQFPARKYRQAGSQQSRAHVYELTRRVHDAPKGSTLGLLTLLPAKATRID